MFKCNSIKKTVFCLSSIRFLTLISMESAFGLGCHIPLIFLNKSGRQWIATSSSELSVIVCRASLLHYQFVVISCVGGFGSRVPPDLQRGGS